MLSRVRRCYDASVEKSYLVLEDLSVAGYANVDKWTGLSRRHFEAVFRKLAKWHAGTAVLLQEVCHAIQKRKKLSNVKNFSIEFQFV